MDENFSMKMSTEDRELLRKLSEIEGESMSTVIRNSLRSRGREYRIWPILPDHQPTDIALRETA